MKKARDEDWAWGYLTKLLSFSPRTEAELRKRLAAKGCPPEVVERVLEKAKQAKLVDDELFAWLYAEARLLSRPRSRKLLAQELRAKGLPEELAARAAARALPEFSERDLAEEALEQRLSLWQGLPEETRKRRAYNFLLRRGFPPPLAREVVEELVAGEGTCT